MIYEITFKMFDSDRPSKVLHFANPISAEAKGHVYEVTFISEGRQLTYMWPLDRIYQIRTTFTTFHSSDP